MTKVSRKVAVTFIADQLEGTTKTKRDKAGKQHWGYQEARDLLDLIYGKPKSKEEELANHCEFRKAF